MDGRRIRLIKTSLCSHQHRSIFETEKREGEGKKREQICSRRPQREGRQLTWDSRLALDPSPPYNGMGFDNGIGLEWTFELAGTVNPYIALLKRAHRAQNIAHFVLFFSPPAFPFPPPPSYLDSLPLFFLPPFLHDCPFFCSPTHWYSRTHKAHTPLLPREFQIETILHQQPLPFLHMCGNPTPLFSLSGQTRIGGKEKVTATDAPPPPPLENSQP